MFEGKTILIVDDDPGNHYVVKDWFKNEGCDFLDAYSWEEFTAILTMSDVDAVITDFDLNMGSKHNGDQVARDAITNDLPVVLLTGNPSRVPKDITDDLGVPVIDRMGIYAEIGRQLRSELLGVME